jgi:hypothetical protein
MKQNFSVQEPTRECSLGEHTNTHPAWSTCMLNRMKSTLLASVLYTYIRKASPPHATLGDHRLHNGVPCTQLGVRKEDAPSPPSQANHGGDEFLTCPRQVTSSAFAFGAVSLQWTGRNRVSVS